MALMAPPLLCEVESGYEMANTIACAHPMVGYRHKLTYKVTLKISEAALDLPRVPIPCGQCIQCKLERSRQWAIRIVNEVREHDISSFVTLTYSDDKLPIVNTLLGGGSTLVKRDVQLFLKRLRKKYPKMVIRYYACGEYGETTDRAHYHAILFGYWPTDVKKYKPTEAGWLYTSKELDSLWANGQTMVGSVSFESAAYVARYALKKITGTLADVHYQGRQPEFALMSRGGRSGRKGIGSSYYDKYGEQMIKQDYVVVNDRKVRPPKYYMDKLKKEDEKRYEKLKDKRMRKLLKEKKVIRDRFGSTIVDYDQCEVKDKIVRVRQSMYKKNII